MRLTIPIFIALFSTFAVADEEMRRAQINAAASEAADALCRQVFAIPLPGDMTVERFVDRFGARDQLVSLLRGAPQIGGTRWLDEQTVQVRLEIGGHDIAKLLEGIAVKNLDALPMPL